MQDEQLFLLINELKTNSSENEWIEFKHNFHSCEEIGETISALSNAACIHGQAFGYLVFGIQDKTREVVGTDLKAKSHKKGKRYSKYLPFWG
jgi:predicted HTH transcriptional regulator